MSHVSVLPPAGSSGYLPPLQINMMKIIRLVFCNCQFPPSLLIINIKLGYRSINLEWFRCFKPAQVRGRGEQELQPQPRTRTHGPLRLVQEENHSFHYGETTLNFPLDPVEPSSQQKCILGNVLLRGRSWRISQTNRRTREDC